MKTLQATSKIKVEYYNGKNNRETTLAETHAQFSDETEEWQKYFFGELERKGKCQTRFATYSIIGS